MLIGYTLFLIHFGQQHSTNSSICSSVPFVNYAARGMSLLETSSFCSTAYEATKYVPEVQQLSNRPYLHAAEKVSTPATAKRVLKFSPEPVLKGYQ